MKKRPDGTADSSENAASSKLANAWVSAIEAVLSELEFSPPVLRALLWRARAALQGGPTDILARQRLSRQIRVADNQARLPFVRATGTLLSLVESRMGPDFTSRLEKKLDQALLREATPEPEARWGHVIWRSRYGARKHRLVVPATDPTESSWAVAKAAAWMGLTPCRPKALTLGAPSLVGRLAEFIEAEEATFEQLGSKLDSEVFAFVLVDTTVLNPSLLENLVGLVEGTTFAPPLVVWCPAERPIEVPLPHGLFVVVENESPPGREDDSAHPFRIETGPLLEPRFFGSELNLEDASQRDLLFEAGPGATASSLLGSVARDCGYESLGVEMLFEARTPKIDSQGRPQIAQGVKAMLLPPGGATDTAAIVHALCAGCALLEPEESSSPNRESERESGQQSATRRGALRYAPILTYSSYDELTSKLQDREAMRRQGHLSRRFAREALTPRVAAHRILTKIGAPSLMTRAPLVSLICVSNRPQLFESCVSTYDRQNYERKELILVANVDEIGDDILLRLTATRSDITVLRTASTLSLGESLNRARAVARGELWTKFDDDDYYSAHYLRDLVFALESTSADICGKGTFYSYLEETNELFLTPEAPENGFSPRYVHGGTILARRSSTDGIDFPPVRRGTDTLFLQQCVRQGRRIYSADRYNFAYVRHSQPGHHTFDVDHRRFLKNSAKMASGFVKDLIDV